MASFINLDALSAAKKARIIAAFPAEPTLPDDGLTNEQRAIKWWINELVTHVKKFEKRARDVAADANAEPFTLE